jgi:hypothetical protein
MIELKYRILHKLYHVSVFLILGILFGKFFFGLQPLVYLFILFNVLIDLLIFIALQFTGIIDFFLNLIWGLFAYILLKIYAFFASIFLAIYTYIADLLTQFFIWLILTFYPNLAIVMFLVSLKVLTASILIFTLVFISLYFDNHPILFGEKKKEKKK